MSRAIIGLIIVTMAGCQEGPPTVLLSIDDRDADLDTIEVSITMTRTAYWQVCEPASSTFDLDVFDLPLLVAVEQGPEYDVAMAYRVTGLRDDAEVWRCQDYATWPDEGVRMIEVGLDACEAHGIDDGVFDDSGAWDAGTPCEGN